MSKITILNDKLSNIDKTLVGLEKIRREKESAIMNLQQKMMELNNTLEEEKNTLEDCVKKINSITELKKESESYYKQIEQGVETLLNILESSTH
jgi:predicted  nucleic acid-binding Zn-ribbon protein